MPFNAKGHKLLILITTARANHLARWIIRQTALIDPQAQKMIELVFLLGAAQPGEALDVQRNIDDELRRGMTDLSIGTFEDSYENLSLKTLMGYEVARERINRDQTIGHVLFHDDDCSIDYGRLKLHTQRRDYGDVGCLREMFTGGRAKRGGGNKNAVSFDLWPPGYQYPTFCAGPCKMMTAHSVQAIASIMNR